MFQSLQGPYVPTTPTPIWWRVPYTPEMWWWESWEGDEAYQRLVNARFFFSRLWVGGLPALRAAYRADNPNII